MAGAILMASGRAKSCYSVVVRWGGEAVEDDREGRGSRNVEWEIF